MPQSPLTAVPPPKATVGAPLTPSADAWPTGFSCTWTNGSLGAAWVTVDGELDMSVASQLEQTLCEAYGRSHLLVLDLRGLGFMDSAGVHVIVDASIRARRAGLRLVVVAGTPNVTDVFRLTGTGEAVEILGLHAAEPAVQVLLQLTQLERDTRSQKVGRRRQHRLDHHPGSPNPGPRESLSPAGTSPGRAPWGLTS